MRRRFLPSIVTFILPLHFFGQSSTAETGKPYFSDPALSPNGQEIAFVSGGDIWTVLAAGG